MISDSCLFVTVRLLFVLRLFTEAEVSTCLKGQGDAGGGAREQGREKRGIAWGWVGVGGAQVKSMEE